MTTSNVESITLKLPPFWTNFPAQWFYHVESQFNTRHVRTEKTKYDYVIAALPQEIVTSVFDVMQQITDSFETETPDSTPYLTIKKALIDRHTLSESARIESLISGVEMGDRKPSEFYRSLKGLAGTSGVVSDKLIINLWMRRLPPMVQATLKALPDDNVSNLTTIADSVYEVFQGSSVNAISKPESRSDSQVSYLMERNQKLELEINEIKHMISKLSTNLGNQRFSSRSRSGARNRTPSRGRDNICWYHKKFGPKASKCTKPCDFKTPN